MAKTQPKTAADYIAPLSMNGLEGRMLHMPAPKGKKREILIVYGHHASLERMFGVAEDLNQYGSVTMPDLPGFGGMQSFYTIHEKPSLDNMADYLAAFIKLRYKRKKVSILGLSLGFVVVTRMLQKYPELTKKVDLLVSAVGFVHKDDFIISRKLYLTLRYGGSLCSRRLSAWLVKVFVLRGPIIRFIYSSVADRHAKLKDADKAEQKARIDFEIHLWKINDVRTHMDTTVTMMTLDLCTQQVDLPVYHIAVNDDQYFDNHTVEQHMRVIFKKFSLAKSRMPTHTPTVIADAESMAPLIPQKIRRLLAR